MKATYKGTALGFVGGLALGFVIARLILDLLAGVGWVRKIEDGPVLIPIERPRPRVSSIVGSVINSEDSAYYSKMDLAEVSLSRREFLVAERDRANPKLFFVPADSNSPGPYMLARVFRRDVIVNFAHLHKSSDGVLHLRIDEPRVTVSDWPDPFTPPRPIPSWMKTVAYDWTPGAREGYWRIAAAETMLVSEVLP